MNDFPPPPPGGQPPMQPGQPGQPGQPTDPTLQYQQPGQPPVQPPVDPLTELDKKRKKQLWIVTALGVVLIIGAFFGGKAIEQKNYEAGADGYNEIYNAGVKSGHAAGTKSGQAEGQEQGEQEGVAKGTEQGKQQGEIEGEKDGANAALGNFSSWSTDTPYVITMQQGPSSEVPFAIASRTLMQPDTFYKICASGKGVCTESDPGPPAQAGSTGQ